MEKKEYNSKQDNKREFGINKLLSTLMLAACLVFVVIEGRKAEMNWLIPVAAVAAALVFVFIPWGRVRENINRIFLRVMFVLTPFAAFWISNRPAGMTTPEIAEKLPTFNGGLNMFIIVLVLFIFYALFNRTKAAIVLTTVLAMVLGVTDYIMMLFRGSPLIAADIASAGTGMDVIANYQMVFSPDVIWTIAVTVIWVSMAVSLRSYKGLAMKKRLLFVAVTVIYTGVFAWLFLFSGFPEDRGYSVTGYRPDLKYEEYGAALAFTVSATETDMKKPAGYSPDAVEKIAGRYKSDRWSPSAKASKKTPDIIVVMNESFSDLAAIAPFETSGRYMPYFSSLKKNVIKGTLHASVIGGGTSVTEHEVLTGNTSAFMPLHKVIYNDMGEEKYPSLATSLKEQGYNGLVAFHPGQADSYNRSKAYPALGFRSFLSVEDMDDPAKIRDYVSDKSDYETVINEYEKYKRTRNDAPYFMFNVTIQNHGGYTLNAGKVAKEIELTDKEAYDVEAEQYLNLIKKSDEALRYLLKYFAKAKDPVVIIMFGDHQPRLSDEFYRALESRMPSGLTDLEKEERKYRVPFMIWSNYRVKGKSGADMSMNYFGPYLKKVLGLKMTGFDRFLMDAKGKLPVVSGICFTDQSGGAHLYGEKTEYADILNDYRMVEYNCVKDTENRVDSFFELKK